MRGQATPIQSTPSETILKSPTTDQPSNKLPSYLQSLHNLQPARPSKVSSGLGSDIRSNLSVEPNTWKLPDLSSLHNVGRTRISSQADAKLVFLQKTFRYRTHRTPPNRCRAPRRSFGGPSGAQRCKASRQRQDKIMVGPGRLELPTPRLSSVCSNQLSYGPNL